MEKTNRLQQLETMLAESPGDAFLLFAIAKEYESMKELDHALQHYHELLKNDPNYVGAYYHLGKLLEELDQGEEAMQIYEAGIEKAEAQNDQHSKRELAEARLNLSIEL